MRYSRVLAAVLAAAVCAFFVIGVRQATSISALTNLASSGGELSPAQQRSAASDLRSARFAYPGQEVQILASQVALSERHRARAESIAEAVGRAEPDNLQGWIAVEDTALNNRDRRAAIQARDEEIRLDPIDTRSR